MQTFTENRHLHLGNPTRAVCPTQDMQTSYSSLHPLDIHSCLTFCKAVHRSTAVPYLHVPILRVHTGTCCSHYLSLLALQALCTFLQTLPRHPASLSSTYSHICSPAVLSALPGFHTLASRVLSGFQTLAFQELHSSHFREKRLRCSLTSSADFQEFSHLRENETRGTFLFFCFKAK